MVEQGALLLVLKEAVKGATDPHVVWQRARELGVDAHLWRWRRELGLTLDEVPEAKHHWRTHVADVLTRRADLGELMQDFPVPVVLLKGEGMAQDLYGDSFARRSGDIDLLVHGENLAEVAEHLKSLGYHPSTVSPPSALIHNQWEWEHCETCRVVEVHWRMMNPQVPMPTTAKILARSVPHSLGRGLIVQIPSPRDQFFLVCGHYHHHSGFLKGLLDVAAWRDRHGEVWEEECMKEATMLGCERLCQWPLGVIDALGGVGVGPWAGVWADRVRGGLVGGDRVSGGQWLAMKTQEIGREEAFLWRVLGLFVLDGAWVQVAGLVEFCAHLAGVGADPLEDGFVWWGDESVQGVGSRMRRLLGLIFQRNSSKD